MAIHPHPQHFLSQDLGSPGSPAWEALRGPASTPSLSSIPLLLCLQNPHPLKYHLGKPSWLERVGPGSGPYGVSCVVVSLWVPVNPQLPHGTRPAVGMVIYPHFSVP